MVEQEFPLLLEGCEEDRLDGLAKGGLRRRSASCGSRGQPPASLRGSGTLIQPKILEVSSSSFPLK
jgi:hypothetical protein